VNMTAACTALIAFACIVGCSTGTQAPAGDVEQKASGHQTASAEPVATKTQAIKPASPIHLPGAARVFTIDLNGDGSHEVLGSNGPVLWAYQIHKSGGVSKLWESRGEGTVHRVVMVAGGDGVTRTLIAARGVGRGQLKAPLLLQAIDPMKGEAREIFRILGERNEPAHLSVADVDRDGQDEVAFAYYQSKYMVVTRHLEMGNLSAKVGKAASPPAVVVGPPMRMATSRVFTDVNGSGGADEVIGRVYGDARGLPGDLKVNLGAGHVTVPTDNGVRGLTSAKVAAKGPAHLYFADGWVANYGKSAKAVLKRLLWTKNGFTSEIVGTSADEFTFFDLTAIDLNGDGVHEIAARGNKRVTIFESVDGAWRQWAAAEFEPVINVAIGRGGDAVWRVFVPGQEAVRAMTVERPKSAL
jgi:hypothetical protein